MTPNFFRLGVKIIPQSSKNEIVGWEGEWLKIKIQKPPEKGRANKALIEFLAESFNISKMDIELASGESSRLKSLLIHGKKKEDILTLLEKILGRTK